MQCEFEIPWTRDIPIFVFLFCLYVSFNVYLAIYMRSDVVECIYKCPCTCIVLLLDVINEVYLSEPQFIAKKK